MNGFPEALVKKTLAAQPQPHTEPSTSPPEEDVPKVLCTPYVKGLSEKIEKICTPLGVKPVFKPGRMLRQELRKVKTKTPEEKLTGVVYESPCGQCDEVYLGETKRTLKVQLGEHRLAVKRGDQKNGIAVHVHNTQHCIDWKGSKIRRRAAGYWERRTTEAIQIRKTSHNMNLDSGLLLPMVWNPILNPPQPTTSQSRPNR